MTTLTPALKRSITSDWKTRFENLGIYQPMWLGRIVGPFFQGICLERSSGNTSYLPTTHIHCLCLDFPTVSLTLAQRLLSSRSGSEERISVQFHEAKFPDAAERLRSAALLPLAASWGLPELINASEAFQRLGLFGAKHPAFLFASIVLAAAWLGKNKQAAELLAKYESCAATWPDNILARHGGYREWADSLRRLIENPMTLRETTERHAATLKVIQLPKVEMLS